MDKKLQINFSGLTNVNVELTNLCNKACWMCGRRKVEREHPDLALKYGKMDFNLVKKIAKQLPPNIVVQFHNNGEGLMYPRFGEAVKLFKNQIKCLTTNGKLLIEKADEIINNLDTIAISIIQDDTKKEKDEQYKIIKQFLKIKGNRKPYVVFRLLGDVDGKKFNKLNGIVAKRVLHAPMGSFNYVKRNPTIPEIGICLDLLNHLAINTKGEVSVCVRFDPKRVGVIGDLNKQSLSEIWNSKLRQEWIELHKKGQRNKVPLCKTCQFWGVPTAY